MYQTKIENALAYAKLGLSTFPVHGIEDGKCSCGNEKCKNIAKHPLTDNGCKAATTDTETLKKDFTGDYERANIGIATGSVSNVWVVDVDDPEQFERLVLEHGPLPITPTVKTSKGTHYYFRLPKSVTIKNSQSQIASGIDVRGEGGYVLAPPSIHASGHAYSWTLTPEDVPFADAPDWLIELATNTITIKETSVFTRASSYLAKCPESVSGQRGHDNAFATVCKLFETFPELRDRTNEDVFRLLEPWNERCTPPWSESELRHKVNEARNRIPSITQTTTTPPNVSDVADTVDVGRSEDVDIDVENDDEEWPTLNEDAYIGFVGDFVRRIEPESEADPVALLVTMLNAFGSMVGRSAYFDAGGVRHYANTFMCVVGKSSRSRKGTSLGYVSSAMRDVDASWDKRRVNGLSSGEGVIAAVAGHDDDDEDADGTITIPDSRLWIVESEFGQTLKVLKREGNTLSPVVRNAWDGGTLSVLTKTNPLRADNAHVSILGHVTVDELNKHIGDETINGFGNRFLWILARRSKLLPHGGNVDVSDLRNRLTTITQVAQRLGRMVRSSEANTLWEKAYPHLVSEKRGTWDAVTSRAEAQTLRLSMLYALLDCSSTINEKHLRAALAVWNYADDSARLIFGEAETLERKIMVVLREHGTMTKTQIRQKISSNDRKHYVQSLSWLVDRGDVRIENERYSISTNTNTNNVQTNEDEDAQSPESTSTDNDPATLGELLDWSNANKNEWRRRADGKSWVINEDGLTSRLRLAILANQETLSHLVRPTFDDPDMESFFRELQAMTTPTFEFSFDGMDADYELTPEEWEAFCIAM